MYLAGIGYEVLLHRGRICSQCGACFATVERLIQHVDDFHPSSAAGVRSAAASHTAAASQGPVGGAAATATAALSSMADQGAAMAARAAQGLGWGAAAGSTGGTVGGGTGEVYRCPHCSHQYSDAVQLVAHVERCTAGAGRAGTAAAGDSNCCVQ